MSRGWINKGCSEILVGIGLKLSPEPPTFNERLALEAELLLYLDDASKFLLNEGTLDTG
jgi:hypothetical protein